MSDKTIGQAALALYKPPFKYLRGYIWDANGEVVADSDQLIEDGAAMRIRGWGRIQYLKEFNPEDLQDEVGKHCALALTQYWEANS